MRLSSHPNVLVCHTSFVRETDLWLVTQLMSKGSALHCLQSARAKLLTEAAASSTAPTAGPFSPTAHAPYDAVLEGGLTAHASLLDPESLLFEEHITYILYETLLGLKYIHDNGQIHRDVKAGNLLLDGHANVRIADFGVSSWLVDGGNRRDRATTFVGTPCWMAPEVMEQVDGYDGRADIWSLGITALELCKGYAPYARFAPMKVLLRTIQEDPPDLSTYDDGDDVEMWSAPFRSLVERCLRKEPRERPHCRDLLDHRIFAPLASAEGRARRRERVRTELCDPVEDVGGAGSSTDARGSLPGATPVRIVSTTKKDRPPGTSWILPGGSEVEAAAAIAASGDGQEDFYAQFEQLTGGENFDRDSVQISQLHADDTVVRKTESKPPKKKDQSQEEKDDINDFFDEFEKMTGGENFRRKT